MRMMSIVLLITMFEILLMLATYFAMFFPDQCFALSMVSVVALIYLAQELFKEAF